MPSTYSILVIGDVHGQLEVLNEVLSAAVMRCGLFYAVVLVGDLGLDFGSKSPKGRPKRSLDDHTASVRAVLERVGRCAGGEDRVVWVPGNHDHPGVLLGSKGRVDGAHARVGDLIFGGAGGATGSWGFPYEITEEDLRRKLTRLYAVDVLVTHQPPKMTTLGRCVDGRDAGSSAVFDFLSSHFFGCAHVCGHIHEARGVDTISRPGDRSVTCLNAGSLGAPHATLGYGRLVLEGKAQVDLEHTCLTGQTVVDASWEEVNG